MPAGIRDARILEKDWMKHRNLGLTAKLIGKAVGVAFLAMALAPGALAQRSTDPCQLASDRRGPAYLSANCAYSAGGATTKKPPVYALEIFGADGDDVVLEYPTATTFSWTDTAIPVVSLRGLTTATSPRGDGLRIDNGQKLDLTYTLGGAVFANSVGLSDLAVQAGRFSFFKKDGGGRGDNFVTFELTGSSQTTLGNINFRVPPLTMAASAMARLTDPGVTVKVTITPLSSGIGKGFPHASVTWDDDADASTEDVQENNVVQILRGARQALNLVAAAGPGSKINVEQRAMLAGADARTQQMKVGDVSLTPVLPSLTPMLADGETKFSVAQRGGSGNLIVKVAGEFRKDDALFLDYKRDMAGRPGLIEAGEMLTLDDDGMMVLELDLEEVVDVEKGIGLESDVRYVPNGKDPLRSGSFRTSVAVEYNRATNRNPTATDAAGLAVPLPLVTELKYEGADRAVKAYAIAPHIAGGDESNVRIRCDAPTDCQVYVACDGADGTGYFGKMTTKIPARGVTTLQTMALAEIIGADAETDFAGRMSCEVIGTGINVQVLTRSGGTLVNNTYVGEEG